MGIELMLKKRNFVTFKKDQSLISDDYENAFNMNDYYLVFMCYLKFITPLILII